MNILMLDDHQDYMALFQKWCAATHPESPVICLGNEEALLRRIDFLPPDVILLDVFMEGRNGFQIARDIRARPDGRTFKIFLLTGIDGDLVIDDDGNLEGVDGFLSKSLGFKRIMEKIGASK